MITRLSSGGIVVCVDHHIEPGDVWVDPDRIAWKVTSIDNEVHLERTDVRHVPPTELARKWRRAVAS